MPVQINELIIRAHVKEPDEAPKSNNAAVGKEAKEEIIKECIERIMELLHQQNER